MRYISEKVLSPNGLFRSRDGEPMGPADDVVVRPSDLLGTVKKGGRNGGGGGPAGSSLKRSGSRCQCKHHQQRQLRQQLQLQLRQEEQRRQLKRQLAEGGGEYRRRHLNAINRHTAKWAGGGARGSNKNNNNRNEEKNYPCDAQISQGRKKK